MAKRKTVTTAQQEKPKALPPSRANYRYVYIPEALALQLDQIAEKDDRSLSYLVKKAVEAYLKAKKPAAD